MASVDDLDELIATRRLNGVDDGLYESDKNVVNMTEEAFNEIIDNFEVVAYLTEYGRRGIKENVKRLQKENEELKEENQRLKAKIDVVNWQEKTAYQCLKEKYIPKQKITDFKEQIKLEPVIVGGRRNKKTLEYGIKLGKIKACEELLKQEETDEKI